MTALSGPTILLGKFAGIPVKIHWTFSLLFVFVGYIAFSNEIPSSELLWFFAYVVLLFLFVIMHEYGHALMARRFGIPTRDIILSPIGGIARLERLPTKPLHELYVAIAGPAVNVVLAFVFFIIQLFIADRIFPPSDQISLSFSDDFIGYLLLINIVLFLFNLLPAFPMDGGRVLRSLLSMIMKDRLKATKWAVIIGQTIAVGFLFIGWYIENYVLFFIGIFVFITARMEYRQMKLFYRMNQTKVADIMRTNFTLLNVNDTLEKILNNSEESNFLISDNEGKIVGSMPELFIRNAIKNQLTTQPIASLMTSSYGRLAEDLNLARTFQLLNERGWAIAEVIGTDGNKKGVIDRQLLLDFMRKSK